MSVVLPPVELVLAMRGVFGPWRIIDRFGRVKARGKFSPNQVTTVGKNTMLSAMFRSGTQSANWYIGLINNTPAPSLAVADTMASHAGWSEWTGYSGTRPAWAAAAPSNGSINNGAAVTFAITANGTIYGMFLADNNTIGGTTGTLWSTAPFSAPVAVLNLDTLQIDSPAYQYTISG